MRWQNRASVPDSLIDLSLRQTLRQSQVGAGKIRAIEARAAKFCKAKIDRTTLDAAELAFGYRNVEIVQHRDDTRILTPPGIPGAGARTQHLDVR